MKKTNFPERCKAEYKRSLNHNYMVIRKPDRLDADYQYSMVVQNDINGLLPMEERISEGTEYIYYEISSMQPIGRIYEHRELDSVTLETTIRGILKACRETEDYMIDFSRLIMDPTCIFMSLDDGSIRLMFSPEENNDEGSLINVAEFFLERISRTDAQAALMAYRFYQTVRKENYVISDIERVLDECRKERKDIVTEEYHTMVTDTERIPPVPAERFLTPMGGNVQRGGKNPETSDRDEHFRGKSEKRFLPESRLNDNEQETVSSGTDDRSGIPLWIPAILATGALAALAGIIPGIGDSGSVKLAAAVILIASTGIMVRSIISRVRNKKNMDSPVEEKDETVKSSMDFDKFFSDLQERPLPDVADDSGKTIFVEPDSDGIRNVLVDRKRGKEYEIDHFPFTIGKLQGTADLILSDRSVSRLHAGLIEENGHVYLQDYNSTNGTFINGVQLMGEERVMLSAEDEVSIGKVCLEYR
ncbi:MAG: FHA domain-containing protein [Lachnospiraceae bacterium]|nr:FHA domain-containing protein [Lachnospiraceae bacterium]